MQRQSDAYTLLFAVIICVICSFTVTLCAEGLRSRQEQNVSLDKKKNILKAAHVQSQSWQNMPPAELLDFFDQKIGVVVLNPKGDFVNGIKPEDIKDGEQLYPLYVYKEQGAIMAYCLPIQGKGLWSTLKGYLAIDADAKTIRGITFYAHKETPGLGAEIEKEWFQNNFTGKSIWDDKEQVLRPPKLVKAVVKKRMKPQDEPYYVDSITGATMTSQGVSDVLDKELNKYEPFLKKVRK